MSTGAAEGGGSVARVAAVTWEGGRSKEAIEELAGEEPLEIRVRGRAITVTMRTPPPATDGEEPSETDTELAAGFLLTEGVIRSAADIDRFVMCGRNEMGNVLDVRLRPLVHVDFERLTRHVFAASSCGLCGKTSVELVRSLHGPVACGARVSTAAIVEMMGRMRAEQATFERTGGLHAAGLFRTDGGMLVVREDVGRHNAVDKVIGHALMRGMTPLREMVLVVSGRTSFEIVQKAAAGGVGIVAAVSAPSSLAVECAKEMGQTLIGFVRGDRMNVYSGAERVVGP